MDITVVFSGNKKIDAQVEGFTIQTDQPVAGGGDGSAPSPYQVFLASLAACAGIYVVGFLQNRDLPLEGVRLVQHHFYDPTTRRLTKIEHEIFLPPSFPEKYREALARVVGMCAVKKTIMDPPEIEVKITPA